MGGERRLSARLATVGKGGRLIPDPQGMALAERLFAEFYRAEVPTVGTPRELAQRMAQLATLVRELIIGQVLFRHTVNEKQDLSVGALQADKHVVVRGKAQPAKRPVQVPWSHLGRSACAGHGRGQPQRVVLFPGAHDETSPAWGPAPGPAPDKGQASSSARKSWRCPQWGQGSSNRTRAASDLFPAASRTTPRKSAIS